MALAMSRVIYAYGLAVGIGLAHGPCHIIDPHPTPGHGSRALPFRGRSYADGIAVGIDF